MRWTIAAANETVAPDIAPIPIERRLTATAISFGLCSVLVRIAAQRVATSFGQLGTLAISISKEEDAACLSDMTQPRRPVRANGRRRFELLLDAAERLLQRDDGQPVTIQRIAREAGVPMASVYHFFPSPPAVSVALAERYMVGFGQLVERPIPERDALGWREVITILHERAIAFYRAHPYAQRLILGSDHSLAIRRSDIANNRRIAQAVVPLIADKLGHIRVDVLLEAIVVGITIGDAILMLSIAEHGEITPALGREATSAACGYLAMKFEDEATASH